MDQGEVMQLLQDMGLTPKPGDEHKHVMSLINDSNTEDGTISLTEAEYLMSSVREYMVRNRRRQERDIQAKEQLSKDLLQEFRSQLLSLYSCFKEMDDDNSGSLDTPEVLNLLQLFGCLSRAMDSDKKNRVRRMVDRQLAMSPTKSLRFAEFVRIIKKLRQLEMQEKTDAVETLFNQTDKDKSGELSIKEICGILSALDMQPRSFSEQGAIAQLIEEADEDGSGQLDMKELLFLVQRIGERMIELRRQEEYQAALALGFTLENVNEFRRVFDILDVSGDGFLGVSEVWNAISMLKWKVNDAKFARIMEDVDEDSSGQLDFTEFLTMLRKADDQLNAGVHKAQKVVDEVKDDEGEDQRTAGGSDLPDQSGTGSTGSKGAKRVHSSHHGPASSAVPGLLDQALKTVSH
eukprot:TRINITY_DN3926_c0_g1_i2.p1 TRINITY_DN3926_c0_g1~~TRINITY_DN3926_c0_g1_i2.p1  ORF type:complete len:476 (-),score=113.53 TRINITY_DN3926_c0_g1_i2:39-1256(-)